MAAVSELVADCATEVLRQIRALRSDGGTWDPLAGAVELLLVGAALGGALSAARTDAQLIAAVFAAVQEESAGFSPKLKSVYEFLKRHRPALIRLVQSQASGSKGGRPGRFVDPLQFKDAARRLRRSKWVLTAQPIALKTPYRELDDWYRRTASELGPALREEQERRGAWLDEVRAAFGAEENRQTILADLKAAMDGVAVTGLPVRRNTLEAARDVFARIQFAEAVRAAATLRGADPPEDELIAFGRGGKADAVAATRSLIKAWSDFLIEAEAEAAAREAEQGVGELESERQRLDMALQSLEAELAALEEADVTA